MLVLLHLDNHNNSLFLVKFVIPQYSEQNPEEARPDETDEESDGLGTLKSKFPNLKISTSGKSGNGSRLTFTKAGTSNKGGESSKGNALSEKKKSTATSGAGAGAEGALSPTSFFRTAGTATKGGDRKVKFFYLLFSNLLSQNFIRRSLSLLNRIVNERT